MSRAHFMPRPPSYSLPTIPRPPPSYLTSCKAEAVPPYTNDISVAALVCRKMEFTNGSVVAKDRAWKNVWCCIEGTSLKVFRDSRAFPQRIRLKSAPSKPCTPIPLDIGSLVYAPFQQQQRSPLDTKHRAALLAPRPLTRYTTSSTSSTSSSSSSSSCYYAPPLPHDAERFLKPSALIRQYTLQGARCGLATGYDKRAHVIRIRVEGEQFLLQLPDLQSVVYWIEVRLFRVHCALILTACRRSRQQ